MIAWYCCKNLKLTICFLCWFRNPFLKDFITGRWNGLVHSYLILLVASMVFTIFYFVFKKPFEIFLRVVLNHIFWPVMYGRQYKAHQEYSHNFEPPLCLGKIKLRKKYIAFETFFSLLGVIRNDYYLKKKNKTSKK